MPSVIIFCKTLLKGGAEKQALTLAKLLKGEESGVIVISWCGEQIDNANLDYIEKNSLKYIGLKGNLLSKFLYFNKIIRLEKISIVFSYLTLANFVAGLSKLFNSHLITIGGIRTEQFPFYKLIFERFVHNHLNDATVFNNYAAKAKFSRKGFREEKIHVIHNSIQVPLMENIKKSVDEIRIISVCRFVPPKDFRTALNSFKRLTEKNRNKNLKYLLAGWGPMEGEIRAMARDLGLDNVEILINPSGIQELLKSGDIYLSTSLFEGLSNSIMEAMAAGLPVVATDVGDSRCLVRDGINGFIFQCRDADTASEKLDWLVNNEASRTEFGNNSYKIILSEFSEAILIDRYRKVISELRSGGVNQNRRAAV